MPTAQDANERFNRLWDEIGAERASIGDEEKGVEIVVDADLSLFGILEKLKEEAARTGHAEGAASDAERKRLAGTLEDCARAFSGGVQGRLRRHVGKLTGQGR